MSDGERVRKDGERRTHILVEDKNPIQLGTKIILVPSFSRTGSVVRVNIRTLECELVTLQDSLTS